jgi:hypothetical protein
MKLTSATVFVLLTAPSVQAFLPHSSQRLTTSTTRLQESSSKEELLVQKKKLLELIGKQTAKDAVLADPITKEAVKISAPGVLFGGEKNRRRVQYKIQSSSNSFQGSSDTFIDLLEPVNESSNASNSSPLNGVLQQAIPMVPFFLRQPLASLTNGEFVPMRDLFTSPAVSFAYERGWRQAFAQAGFPGADTEAQMAMDYFAPVVAKAGPSNSVVVDMSCATGKLK